MRYNQRQDTFPPAIFTILLACAAVFVLLGNTSLSRYAVLFALWPGEPLFRVWQPVTYALLHADLYHLGFNMFALWMFGRSIEYEWGTQRFAIYFLVCVLGGALGQFVLSVVTGSGAPMVGASGGVYGVLLAFGMTYPNQRIMLLFPPIPMKAKFMVIVFGLLELYLGISGRNTGVAHFAHLGGMVLGFALLTYWRSQRPRRRF